MKTLKKYIRCVNGIKYNVFAGWQKGPVLAYEYHAIVSRLDNGEKDTTIPVRNGGKKTRGSIVIPFQPMPI
jgi:hypothetical protein